MKRLALLALCACSSPARAPAKRTELPAGTGEPDEVRRKRLIADLEDDVRSSYERDDLPDIDTPLIPPQVGPARIGVGPGDVLFGEEVRQRASSRWPLFVAAGTVTAARSKRLDVHLAQDRNVSAAWVSDEISWRIPACGHIAAIPLRLTALYAHDGDRWVEVFEHLSFARTPPQPYFELVDNAWQNVLRGAPMVRPHEAPVIERKLADELSGELAALFSRQPARITGVVSLDPGRAAEDDSRLPAPTLVLAPDADGEWHGDQDVARLASLVDGTLRAEDRRVGTVGPSLERSTIAYWVGNFIADLPARPEAAAGKVRLRGTFVFEKRAGKWVIVQGHLSEPIDDFDLATQVFGTSLLSEKPLQLACPAGRESASATVPAAAPSSPAPVAGSP
jgi:hypothetical protein